VEGKTWKGGQVGEDSVGELAKRNCELPALLDKTALLNIGHTSCESTQNTGLKLLKTKSYPILKDFRKIHSISEGSQASYICLGKSDMWKNIN